MRRAALCAVLLLVPGCASRGGQLKPITPTTSTVATSTVTATLPSTTTPASSPLSADQIVLSLDELNALTGEATYRGGEDLANTSKPFPPGGPVEPKECAPALRGLQNRSVAGDGVSSFRAAESMTVGDPALPEEKRRKDDFVQVVAVYPSVAAAAGVFSALVDGVGSCRDKQAVDVDPESGAKTQYEVKVAASSPTAVQWSQRQPGWGEYQRCVLEARLVKNVVLQDIECGAGSAQAPVGALLPRVLDKTAGRIG